MKIISLQAENIKRLVAVEIKPDGSLVQITGRNNQGKSSILDAIWWALEGARHIQSQPIRRGAEKAFIRLDLGEIVVTRKFTRREAEKFTTTITVENAEGARFSSPQEILNGLFGALTFDPLAFTRLDAKSQVAEMRKLIPGIDFSAIDAANAADFAKRTDLNRDAASLKARAEAIKATEAIEPIDEAGLIAELEAAGQHNAKIEADRAQRENMAAEIHRAVEATVSIENMIQATREKLAELETRATEAAVRAAGLSEAKNKLPPLPAPIDTAEIRAQINGAKEHNARAAQAAEKAKLSAEALKKEVEAGHLTKAMRDRAAEVARAVQAAQLPVPGLALGEGEVLLNGLPLSQASGAEQLRLSMAVAMAGNSKLQVIRIKEGSLLDDEGMRIVAEMAEASGFQVWIEKVTNGQQIGFVIEDGALKQPMLEAAE